MIRKRNKNILSIFIVLIFLAIPLVSAEWTSIEFEYSDPSRDELYTYKTITNEHGIKFDLKQDKFGNLIKVIQNFEGEETPLDIDSTYTYDLLGNLISVSDPIGNIANNIYNVL